MLKFFKKFFNTDVETLVQFNNSKELKIQEVNKFKIVAIQTNKKDVIKQVKFDDGEVADIKTAIEFAEQGLIEGVEVFNVRNGNKALRAIPDANANNNLKDLPRF